MNAWTKISAELAQQKNYLDELYKVYPITQNPKRELSKENEKDINFCSRNHRRSVPQRLHCGRNGSSF